ncbi:MAG: histidine phosphatase family protein [Clostridia bacterium]|nr:histidine phosphatase family protein [Clostridia bacterium]
MIFLIRHGEDDNTRLGGWSDAALSSNGIEQVRLASEQIAQGNYNIKHIFSSDLPRAKETADTIAKRLEIGVTLVKEFREINNGDLAGISKERFQVEYPGLYYRSLAWDQPYPNGESPEQFYNRINSAWKSFKKDAASFEDNVLLVTHGGVIDIILCIENGDVYTNKFVHFKVASAEIVAV